MESSLNLKKVLDYKVIHPKSLSVMAADMIRPNIICGNIPMGEALKEPEFSETLKVSRSCIREAFMILERDGLIERSTNKSARVVTYTEKDIWNIYQFRIAIETSCVERCLRENIIEKKEFEELALEIDKNYKENPQDTFSWLEHDYKFHSYFVDCCNNIHMYEVYKSLMYQVEMLICHCAKLEPERFLPNKIGASHDALVKYICDGDHERAMTYLKNHLSGTPRIIVEVLKEYNEI